MKKIIIFILIFIILFFIIKSRIVPNEHFEIMVMHDFNEIYNTCNKIKEADINGIEYNLTKDEQYYFNRYGYDFCNQKDSIRYKIEENIKESLRENWLFVF